MGPSAKPTHDPLVLRIEAEQARARAHAARLREAVPRVARELRARGARRVRLFGSLATGAEPHAGTDIDLAVEGMDEGGAAEALLALESSASIEGALDLVRWETASERLRRAIDRDGVEVGDVAP